MPEFELARAVIDARARAGLTQEQLVVKLGGLFSLNAVKFFWPDRKPMNLLWRNLPILGSLSRNISYLLCLRACKCLRFAATRT